MISVFRWRYFCMRCFNLPIVLRLFSTSLCILLAIPRVMSLEAGTKSDSTTQSQMSGKEVSSRLLSSVEETVMSQSRGEQGIYVEESQFQGQDQSNKLMVDERRTENDALENEAQTCKTHNLPAVESITTLCSAGQNVATVSSLNVEQTDKEASEQEEPRHIESRPASDVCAPAEVAGCSAAGTEVCSSNGDAQDSLRGVGKLTVQSPLREKNPTVTEEKTDEASEIKLDHVKLESLDDDLDIPVSAIEAKPEDEEKELVKDTLPESDSDDDDDDDEDGALMGYHFNKDGVLVDKNGEQFEFRRYEDHARNQKRYEKLGEKINNYVYSLLETKCKLKKVHIPLDAEKEEPRSFIFVSEDAFKTEDKLIIFIHGSGVVRAGQWSRSLIINHSLAHGTQIPYIEKALMDGYEVIVLNTNLNSLSKRRWPSDDELIRGSENPEKHALYVWENIIEKKVKAKHIAIIAHSYGGVVTKELVSQKHDQFSDRVFAIALTDSVHGLNIVYDSAEVIEFFRDHARNWVTSSLPLDEKVKGEGLRYINDAPRVSAGHEKHEWTSWSSFESIFKFLDNEYRSFFNRNDQNSKAQKATANL